MSSEELEALLASLPTRQLSPAAEAEILHAVATAAPRTQPWWRRPVPLWQAVAACLLAAVAAGGLVGKNVGTRSVQPKSPPEVHAAPAPAAPQVVAAASAGHSFFRRPETTRYVLDISRWRPLPATKKGDETP